MTCFTEGVDDMVKVKLWPDPSGYHVEPRLQGEKANTGTLQEATEKSRREVMGAGRGGWAGKRATNDRLEIYL